MNSNHRLQQVSTHLLCPHQDLKDPRETKNEGLKRLKWFKIEDAQKMMTSKEWTRAVFVREPKERILSAFLNKFVGNKSNFYWRCCSETHMPEKIHRDECRDRQEKADFRYFLYMSRFCDGPHWSPQRDFIDPKWWPYMTFIGYLHSAGSDAKRLLESVKSSKDNLTAWEKFGSTGWGEDGTASFMSSSKLSYHRTDARAKMTKYYTKCDEVFVEKYSARDWESPFFRFDKIELYERSDNETENLYRCGLL
jgi:hypothetical protein